MIIKNIFIFYVVCFLSCAPSAETEKETKENDLAARYEESFDPSEFDEEVDINKEKSKHANEYIPRKDPISTEPDIINGFRVQLLMTKEIEEANKLKSDLNTLLQEDWVYVVFESPYYKVRVGDFPLRGHANEAMTNLINLGYKNSWIVPDKIVKNPPPKPKENIIPPTEQQ